MKETISVIIPVHNAEKYLHQCLDSVINQTYKKLDIILVDDNSTDQSGVICDEYASKDTRIHVLHDIKGGEGGAKARNAGISIATGELFYFIDSDDYIEPNMLTEMYDIMCKDESQCTVCSFHYVDENEKDLPWQTPQLADYHAMTGVEAAKVFLTTLNIEGFSWNKLIRREILVEHNILFDDSMNSFVDMYAMFRAILYSNKVSFCNKQLYYYRQLATSCVHTMSQRKLNNFYRVIKQITQTAKEQGITLENQYFYTYRMARQLYDAIKAKRDYNKQVWEQIRRDFSWEVVFHTSLIKSEKCICSYKTENCLKNCIKLIMVWINFR